jgi:hypothetical protein
LWSFIDRINFGLNGVADGINNCRDAINFV